MKKNYIILYFLMMSAVSAQVATSVLPLEVKIFELDIDEFINLKIEDRLANFSDAKILYSELLGVIPEDRLLDSAVFAPSGLGIKEDFYQKLIATVPGSNVEVTRPIGLKLTISPLLDDGFPLGTVKVDFRYTMVALTQYLESVESGYEFSEGWVPVKFAEYSCTINILNETYNVGYIHALRGKAYVFLLRAFIADY